MIIPAGLTQGFYAPPGWVYPDHTAKLSVYRVNNTLRRCEIHTHRRDRLYWMEAQALTASDGSASYPVSQSVS